MIDSNDIARKVKRTVPKHAPTDLPHVEPGVSLEWICKVVTVLREPARRTIVLCLAGRSMNAQSLSMETGLCVATIEQHLRLLRRFGIVESCHPTCDRVISLAESVAVAFANGMAEARITAADGDVVSFVSKFSFGANNEEFSNRG